MTKITVDKTLIEQAIAAMPDRIGVSRFALRQKLRAALAEPAPVQEPAKKLWLQRGVFPDLADFDTNGLPRFYSKESADKFQIGQCSKPCAGKNCGSMNGWMHSIECRAEHDAVITAPQARPAHFEEQPDGTARNKAKMRRKAQQKARRK